MLAAYGESLTSFPLVLNIQDTLEHVELKKKIKMIDELMSGGYNLLGIVNQVNGVSNVVAIKDLNFVQVRTQRGYCICHGNKN